YAINDIKFMILIDDKYNITNYFWEIKQIMGLENMERSISFLTPIDTIFLRYSKQYFNYVLPNHNYSDDSERGNNNELKGALVLEPPKGLFNNVSVIDFSRFYPSIILALQLSPDNPERLKEGDFITPFVVRLFVEERAKYDKILDSIDRASKEYKIVKLQRHTKKYCLNAIYGLFGAKFSRLYDLDIANAITGTGQQGLKHLDKKAEENGFEVLYGDTDSIFVKTGSVEGGKKAERILGEAIDVLNHMARW
ncbi:MAG: DNA polymerase domain-containing protein, partial [Candidatus Hodarchaeales archaeon]